MIKSGMPQMGPAFAGWTQQITLGLVQQYDEKGLTKKRVKRIRFQGTIQPLKPTELQFKPEALRRFPWLQIHMFTPRQRLDTNDIIEYDGRRYKVLGVYDYSLNNFFEYHVVEDMQND